MLGCLPELTITLVYSDHKPAISYAPSKPRFQIRERRLSQFCFAIWIYKKLNEINKAYDAASVSQLLSRPPTILLDLFYRISPTTLTFTTLSSILSGSLPYYFIRPLSPGHVMPPAPRQNPRCATPRLNRPHPRRSRPFFRHSPSRTFQSVHLGASCLPALLITLAPADVAWVNRSGHRGSRKHPAGSIQRYRGQGKQVLGNCGLNLEVRIEIWDCEGKIQGKRP